MKKNIDEYLIDLIKFYHFIIYMLSNFFRLMLSIYYILTGVIMLSLLFFIFSKTNTETGSYQFNIIKSSPIIKILLSIAISYIFLISIWGIVNLF